MVETRKVDEDRQMDQTLLLFQNALAEAETAVPTAQSGRAVEEKDLPLSKPAERRAASLIGGFVAFARTVAGLETTAAQTAPSLQPPVDKSAWKDPVENVRFDPLVGRALSTVPMVQFDEPVDGAVEPPSFDMTEAPASPRQPPGRSASRGALHLERPTQESPHAPIDRAHSARVATATEEPVGDELSAPLADQPLSMDAFVSLGESSAAETTPSQSLDPPEVGAVSIRQPVAKAASRALTLEYPAPQESPIVIKDARSLVIKKVFISEQKPVLIKQLLISEPTTAQLGHPSQRPRAHQGPKEPVLDALSDALVDQALSVITDGKPNAVGAAPLLSADGSEAVGSLRKPSDESVLRDILPSARPVQEISLIDHALSLVKGVVISERNAVLVKKVAISEFNGVNAAPPSPLQSPVDKPALEKPAEAPQSETPVDHAPSMIAVVPNSETDGIETASPLPDTAGTEVFSLQRPIDESASLDVLRSLERLAQEKPTSIDRAYPAVVGGASTALTTENAVSLVEQPLLAQLSPEDRLDEELADIRRRVAAFKEHQQRFRREREEYSAATMASACGSPVDAAVPVSGRPNLPQARDGNQRVRVRVAAMRDRE